MVIANVNLYDAIDAAKLSPVTKRVYRDRISGWLSLTGAANIEEIVLHPSKYLTQLKKEKTNNQTVKSYISAILALFRYNPEFKQKHKKAYDGWYKEFNSVHHVIDDKYRNNEASERQVKGYVPLAKIIEVRDSLPIGSIDRLLFSIYTHIPPLRADFNDVEIFTSDPPNGGTGNFIVLPPEGAISKPKLVLTEFKTKSAFNRYERQLPDAIVQELRASLNSFPRKWLFVDRSNKPYNAHGFVQFANRTFKKHTGKPLTITLMRHIYISSIDFNKITTKEREEIAAAMTHSVGMQDRYRLILRDNMLAEPIEVECKPVASSVQAAPAAGGGKKKRAKSRNPK